MKKWRYMLWGGIGAGKTTLMRVLEGGPRAQKTQAIEFWGAAIDTPGEYSETKLLSHRLLVTSAEAQLFLVVQDATRAECHFPPNYFLMYHQPVIGVITKIDRPEANIERATATLKRVGVTGEIYRVSSVTGEGLEDLKQILIERSKKWQVTAELMAKRSA